MTRIRVDEENNAEEFWMAVNQDPEMPEEIGQVGLGEPITVTNFRADELETYCSTIPGYDDGPDYAPTALIFDHLEADNA